MPNLIELARRADVDERSIVRFFSGMPMKPRVRARIERAMREMRKRSSASRGPRSGG